MNSMHNLLVKKEKTKSLNSLCDVTAHIIEKIPRLVESIVVSSLNVMRVLTNVCSLVEKKFGETSLTFYVT